jgi:membrane protein
MASAGETLKDAAGTATEAAEPALSVGKEVVAGIKEDHVTLMGAGVAFYGFLAFIPALVALVSVYGLVGDPDNIQSIADELEGAMPAEAQELIIQQLESITSTSGSALSIGLAVSTLAALWATSSGMSHLVEAVNLVHGHTDERNMVHRRLLGIGLTVGAIVFAIVAVSAITIWPGVVDAIGPPSPVDWLLKLAVWPVLAVALAVALAVLYHVGPDRDADQWRWLTWGSGIAVLLWLVASIAFQVYASNFGSYNETYGSLGAIVIMLLWLWISATVVLVGAEINAVLERRRTS